MKLFKDMVTGKDNATFDAARVLWIAGVIAFFAFTAYDIYKGNHFDMVNYGTAYGLLLAGGAAGVKIKETTEPTASA